MCLLTAKMFNVDIGRSQNRPLKDTEPKHPVLLPELSNVANTRKRLCDAMSLSFPILP